MRRKKAATQQKKKPKIRFSSIEQLMAYYFPNEALGSEGRDGTKRGVATGKQILAEISKAI